jgi:stage V sporulation protein SpoVS
VHLSRFCADWLRLNSGLTLPPLSILDQQDTPVACEPSFRDTRNEVTLKIVKVETITDSIMPPTAGHVDMTVSSKSKITEVAGAIAAQVLLPASPHVFSARFHFVPAQVRESRSVSLMAIGQNAVFNAIRAVAVAREYLKQRGDEIDLLTQNEFVEVGTHRKKR